MAGHSKWANIKHRKARQDAKRGKLWTRVLREVTVAARLGGGADDNPRLRAALDKALAVNVPKDTIDRAVARGLGGGEGSDLEEITYEGYAAGGVAILVEVMTDNRNRAVAEVRYAFSKHGGSLGSDGSVTHLFSRKGLIQYGSGADEERLLDTALEAGAEDLITEPDGAILVTTPWELLGQAVRALEAAGLPPEQAEVTLLPKVMQPCDARRGESLMGLVDALEELDDVQNVYTNAKLPDAADA